MSHRTDPDGWFTRGFGRGRQRLGDAFYPLYERLFDESGTFVGDLEGKLAEARIDRPVELYLTWALALGAISGLLLWLLGIVVGFALFGTGTVEVGTVVGIRIESELLVAAIETAKVPFLILVSGMVLGVVGFASVFGYYLLMPYSRSARRRREIDMLLPDAVSFMYALSVGGMNQLEILETMATAENTYGEVAREFGTVVQETEYFDTDYRTAIQKRASRTPSTELGQFFTDMLSIINSGGDLTEFLDDKKDQHYRTAREQQERVLETLELLTEMYITLSLFPLLLIIVLVLMRMIGQAGDLLLYATVYAVIPMIGAGFLVLVSTIKQDEPGNGILEFDSGASRFEGLAASDLWSNDLIREFTGTYSVFDWIERRGGTYRTVQLLRRPHLFFRDNPFATLLITIPAAWALVVVAVLSGSVPVTWDGVVSRPLWSTVVYAYVPLFLVCLPLSVFWEWNDRSRRAVLDSLSENLRKLASANATGLTFLESVKMVADTSPGKLAEEFDVVYAKCSYGMAVRDSLVVFNNKYRVPRLARTVKLVGKAHEISGEISDVLSTAAKATELQEDIERDRTSRARMQVAIILMAYFTLLAVMAVLKVEFIEVMAEFVQQAGTGGDGGTDANPGFGTAIDVNQLSLLFFHAVTLQAIVSGLICGYVREGKLVSGVKYVVVLLTVALAVWVVVA